MRQRYSNGYQSGAKGKQRGCERNADRMLKGRQTKGMWKALDRGMRKRCYKYRLRCTCQGWEHYARGMATGSRRDVKGMLKGHLRKAEEGLKGC